MRSITLINLAVVILLLTGLCFSCTVSEQKKSLQNIEIEEYVEKVMERYGIPGASLAIIKDGEIQYQNNFKLAVLEHDVPVNKNVLFQLSSLSKIFTSIAAFQLIEEQKISLESKVSDYLNDLPTNWQNVKVKHLLSHTSGLPEIAVYEKFPEDSAKSKVFNDEIQFIPGSKSRYNNTNFWLLKRIIEKVTGQNFEDHIVTKQFKSSTNPVIYAGNFYDIVNNRATSYEPDNNGVFQLRKYEFPEFLYGAAGLNISIEDFIIWNEKLENGHLLNDKTKSLMWTQFQLNNKESINFTFGWHIRKPNNRISVGFSGGYNTGFRKFLDDDLTIILLTNGYQTRFNIERLIENLAGLIDEDLENNESQIHESLLTSFLVDENKEAVEYYKKVKDKNHDKEFENILNSIGYELLKFNNIKKAIDVFVLNVEENPNSWNAYDSLGEAYDLLGDKDKAIENYKKSVLLNPANEHAKNRILSIE